jgi:superfamily II DNA or RNA helicase
MSLNQPRIYQEVRLRTWQQEAFGTYQDTLARGGVTTLWEATPGAGKTTAALIVCLHQLRKNGASKIIVVVPTAHLKIQWARAATSFGVNLEANFSRQVGLATDYHGLVVTYQQIAQDPVFFRNLTRKACVVLDEIHHTGDGLTWGDSIRIALGEVQFILGLSGTPFRSDRNPIPFVDYNEEGLSVPDYTYPYTRAVEDGVCRPTAFFTYGGDVSWSQETGLFNCSFADPLDAQTSGRRLKVALDTESGWIFPMLQDANRMLSAIRTNQPEAGGLVVASSQDHARALAKMLGKISATKPVLVLSDDANATERLKSFSDSGAPWLVACNMVSEGVDIPRLRVGVYATTVRTKMYFRQFIGRIVRKTGDNNLQQVAYCYLPADPVLTMLAQEIEGEIRHYLKYQKDDEWENVERAESKKDKEKVQNWQSLQSVNSGLTSVIVHGSQVKDNQLNLFSLNNDVHVVQAAVHEQVAVRLSEKRSLTEEKSEKIKEIRRLVGIYHQKTKRPHAAIHTELNAKQGVRSQTHCTIEQLRTRIVLLRGMVNF